MSSVNLEKLESRIIAIIREIYATTEFEDECRADQAAHEIVELLKAEGYE